MIAEHAEVTLARRPPVSSLFKAVAFLLLLFLALFGMYAMVASDRELLNPAAGSVFWFRVGFLILMGLFALWMLLLLIRIFSRWTLPRAGIFYSHHQLSFRVPKLQRWWNPLLRIQEVEILPVSIRDTRFTVHGKSTLTIESDTEQIRVPSGTFAVGGYTLDAKIRGLVSRESGRDLSCEPQRIWVPSAKVRLTMVILGILFLPGPLVVIPILLSANPAALVNSATLFTPVLFAGLALLTLSFVYSGSVVIDPRGIFREKGGTVSFLSWDALAEGRVRRHAEAITLGLWSHLDIESATSFKRGPECRIRLSRILGLGFPLKEIERALPNRHG